jgi:glyoxylase-like metal-dependent hydrolase (beta-lactamase superfamily II)
MIAPPHRQIPGVYHRRIGEIVVTALSDGYLDSGLDMLRNITVEESARLLHDAFRPDFPGGGRRTSVNGYAIHSAGRLALIDTGSGNYLQPSAGKLMHNLAAANIDPAAIERVILTHMHPDHSAGLSEMPTGRRVFPNAELVMDENELRHWHDDAAMARASERAKTLYFQAAREQMAPYRDRLHIFSDAGEVFPGVSAMPLHGHTPGHTGYLITSGGNALLIWGDIVHVPEIQVPRPEVTIDFDTDPDKAAATRRHVLDMAASERLLIAGMHVHYPGFANIARNAGGHVLVPEAWDQAFLEH